MCSPWWPSGGRSSSWASGPSVGSTALPRRDLDLHGAPLVLGDQQRVALGDPAKEVRLALGEPEGIDECRGRGLQPPILQPTPSGWDRGLPPATRGTWQRRALHLGGAMDLIQMGLRLYDPALRRFLESDPVAGGSATLGHGQGIRRLGLLGGRANRTCIPGLTAEFLLDLTADRLLIYPPSSLHPPRPSQARPLRGGPERLSRSCSLGHQPADPR